MSLLHDCCRTDYMQTNSPATKLPENKELQKPSTTVQCRFVVKRFCHCRPSAMALCRIRHHQMSAANSQTPFPHLVWRIAQDFKETCASRELLPEMLADQRHLTGWYVWRHQPDPDSQLACCRSTEFKTCHHGKHLLVNIILFFFPVPTLLVPPHGVKQYLSIWL